MFEFRYLRIIFFSVFLLMDLSLPANEEIEKKLSEAYRNYQWALASESTAYQEQHFNAALSLYHEIEEQLSRDRDLAPLYYNLGNIYFYLSEYPLAIVYYNRAAQTMPDNPNLIKNLNYTMEKLGFTYSYTPPLVTYFEALKIFGAFASLAIMLFSISIWIKHKAFVFTALAMGIVGVFFLCTAIALLLTAPVEAVVIYPSLLRKGASGDFSPVSEEPLIPGVKVQVLDVVREGKWLKVSTQNQEIGYLSYKTVRTV